MVRFTASAVTLPYHGCATVDHTILLTLLVTFAADAVSSSMAVMVSKQMLPSTFFGAALLLILVVVALEGLDISYLHMLRPQLQTSTGLLKKNVPAGNHANVPAIGRGDTDVRATPWPQRMVQRRSCACTCAVLTS